MHRRNFITHARWRTTASTTLALALAVAFALSAVAAGALAQTTAKPEGLTLSQAFEAAWARQPELAALAARRDAARAQQQAAQSWTPEPVAVEVTGKTDRLNRNLGTREYEAGLAIPLWLPGERGRSQALAQAEGRAIESRTTAAQLRVAAAVREAWWNWQRARADAATAQGQLDNAQRIAADVGKRLKAGDLARADQHQAAGATATAQVSVAQAQAALIVAEQALRTLLVSPGLALTAGLDVVNAEPEPEPGSAVPDLDGHGELLALKDRAAAAEGLAALTATQSRVNPELLIATTRERDAPGEPWQQTLTVGVRIPFGAGPRHDARTAAARAETIELQAQLNLERVRLSSERDSAKARTESARLQLTAAERRAQLARETRGFFDKSFRLGETDLPTRLRIEAEATEAERQAARSRIELAAAISSWRQALGVLPQ
jgi:cobalt-zinc-cadmium efflux system outer membrane protein